MADILSREQLEQKWIPPGPFADDDAFEQWDDIKQLRLTALWLAEQARLAAFGAVGPCENCPCKVAARNILEWWEAGE